MAHNLVSLSKSFTFDQISRHFQQLGLREVRYSARQKRRFGPSGPWGPQNKCSGQRKAQQWNLSVSSSARELSSMFYCRAINPNMNEDTDEMFDDLFNKYGKVVFKRKDQKPTTAEIDDDAESLSFAVAMAKVANDVKAADIRVLFVKPLVYWTRFFIIATAFSRPQIDAIRTKMADLAEEKFGKVPNGDSKPNSWTLLDFGDVVVHIFLPQQREFYNLEEFYGNAMPIELQFEDEKPFHR